MLLSEAVRGNPIPILDIPAECPFRFLSAVGSVVPVSNISLSGVLMTISLHIWSAVLLFLDQAFPLNKRWDWYRDSIIALADEGPEPKKDFISNN